MNIRGVFVFLATIVALVLAAPRAEAACGATASPPSLTNTVGQVGTPLTFSAVASGAPDFFWQLTGGTPPSGTSFSGGHTSTATISGTPTAAGPFSVTFVLYDYPALEFCGSYIYNFTILAPPQDSGAPDGSTEDASTPPDASAEDASTEDASTEDASAPDASAEDASTGDDAGECGSAGESCALGCCDGLGCENETCCAPSGGNCATDSDCCDQGGIASCLLGICQVLTPDGGLCKQARESCNADSDCCVNTIEPIKCQQETHLDPKTCCVANGEHATDATHCCSSHGNPDPVLGVTCSAVPFNLHVVSDDGCDCNTSDGSVPSGVLLGLAVVIACVLVRRSSRRR